MHRPTVARWVEEALATLPVVVQQASDVYHVPTDQASPMDRAPVRSSSMLMVTLVSSLSTGDPCASVNCNGNGGGGTCVATGGGSTSYTCTMCSYGSSVSNGMCAGSYAIDTEC